MSITGKKYDAFISYRHCEPDKRIAAVIQKKLENYSLPPEENTKLRKKTVLHVFRDESEFAVSPDLSESIIDALKQSEYLIIICSPRLKDSEWCRKELDTFLEISDRNHILLVVADGEPDEVFPKILTADHVEPLAADCRGNTKKERRQNMEQSVIRLAASILGKGYDDLRQRHRRQQAKKRNLIMLAVFLAVAMIAAQSLIFLHKISEQNRIITDKYADVIAASSESLLAAGRRLDAIYAARSVLPDKEDKSVNINAFRALTDAEGLFLSPLEYTCGNLISIPSTVSSLVMSADSSLAGLLGFNQYRYIVDTDSGEVIYSFEEEPQYLGILAFDGTEGILLRRTGEPFVYRDLRTSDERVLCEGEGKVYTAPDDKGAFLISSDGIARICSGTVVYTDDYKSLGIDEEYGTFDINLYFSADGEHSCISYSNLNDKSMILQFNTQTGKKEAVITMNVIPDTVSTDGNMLYYTYTEAGTSHLVYYDTVEGKEAGRMELLGGGYFYMCVAGGLVVIASNDYAQIYRPKDGAMSGFTINGRFGDMQVSEEGILITDQDGGFYICKDTYQIYTKLGKTDKKSYSVTLYRNGRFFMMEEAEKYVVIYERRNSDHCRPYAGEPYTEMIRGYADEEKTRIFKEKVYDKDPEMDHSMTYASGLSSDGKYGYIQSWNGEVRIYDTDTAELIKILYDCEGYCFGLIEDAGRGFYYLCCSSAYIFDNSFRHLATIPDLDILGTLDETGEILVGDNDGNKFVISMITYSDVIEEADRVLSGYTPEEAVRAKYGF